MLLSIHYPFTDLRRFFDVQTGVLTRPTWPAPDPYSEFVRSFGAIRNRRRGGIIGWVGESEVCEANRAFQFLEFPSDMFNCEFRRLFFDGLAVGRFEVGVSNTVYTRDPGSCDDYEAFSFVNENFLDIVQYFLLLRIQFKFPHNAKISSTIGEAGTLLAKRYAYSTTSKNLVTNFNEQWVLAGSPLLFLEFHEYDGIEITHLNASHIISDKSGEIKLYHAYIDYDGKLIPIWILKRKYFEYDDYKDNHKGFVKARTLKLYLLRLHAENQCLRIVLRNMATARIPININSEATDRLQWYLNEATKRISRWENNTEKLISTNKFKETDIAMLVKDIEDKIVPGQRDALLNLLARENLRFNVKCKVYKYVGYLQRAEKNISMVETQYKKGQNITTSVAFIAIKGLKQVNIGIQIHQLISVLHNNIKDCISDEKYRNVRVLSALIGAILIMPDESYIEPLDLLHKIAEKGSSLGIPLRIGITHGETYVLEDADESLNFIGVPINTAARLATSETNEGMLVDQSIYNHILDGLNSGHWLLKQACSEIEDKHGDKYPCYRAPSFAWPACSEINFNFDENYKIAETDRVNASLICYDLPKFSQGNLNQLKQRFNSVIFAFKEALASEKQDWQFYLSPGGDGGIFIFHQVSKEKVYEFAERFVKKLEIETKNKDVSISVDCRVGLHYALIPMYENAEGKKRPTGANLFITDNLASDTEAKESKQIVFTEFLKDAISSDPHYFDNYYKSITSLYINGKEVKRYVKRSDPVIRP